MHRFHGGLQRSGTLRRALLCVFALLPAGPLSAQSKTRNVILITLDGARTQEIFGGLDLAVLKSTARDGKVEDTPTYRKYWAPTPHERREKLLPFLWTTLLVREGSIAGNAQLGSLVRVTNTHRFSYPGYSEILTGEARDDLIRSNAKKLNPSPTVLEVLRAKLALDAQRVVAFASWDVLDAIVMHTEGSITSNAGYERYETSDPALARLSEAQSLAPSPWDTVRHDYYTFQFAADAIRRNKPRVVYIGLGETDDWAHDGRYDMVLEALHRADQFLRELWDLLAADASYRGTTTVLLTTDHGRGNTPSDWRDHGEHVEGAQYIWIACFSPDSSLRGEWVNAPAVEQSQIAATLCEFLGVNYSEVQPRAGKPIARFFDN